MAYPNKGNPHDGPRYFPPYTSRTPASFRAVAGKWTSTVTLDGPHHVVVAGTLYNVPATAQCKLVTGGRFSFLHVKVGKRVTVVSPSFGQLVEDDLAATARATKPAWDAIRGVVIRH